MKNIWNDLFCRIFTGLIISLFLAGSAAWAGIDVIPFSGYRLSGEFEDAATGARLDVDESSSAGIIVNIDERPGAAYEFLYSKQSSRLTSDGSLTASDLFDVDIEYIHLGGVLLKQLSPDLSTFFGAGIGVTHLSPDLSGNASETKASFNLAGGYKYHLNPYFGFYIGGRLYGTLVDSQSEIFCGDGACKARFRSDMYTQFEMNVGLLLTF